MMPGYHTSLVFRLMVSIFVVMVAVFSLGNVITVQLAQNSLKAQGERQLELQKEQLEKQVQEARERLRRKVQPQIDMLMEFSKGPLIMRVNEVESHSNLNNGEVIDAFRTCFDTHETESPLFHCLRTNIFQLGTARIIASLNRTFVTTAINFLVQDEDMVGVFVEDWDEGAYAGFLKGPKGQVIETSERPEFGEDAIIIERDILEDEEYIGKLYFVYTSKRILAMEATTQARVQKASQLIDENIAKRSWEITVSRLIEGILFFLVLMVAISLISLNTIIRPLKTLKDSADQLAHGVLDEDIDTTRRDEIGSLAKSFAIMRDAIRRTISELHVANEALSKAKHRLEKLLEGTREIASAREKFTPIIKSLDIILSEITTLPDTKVSIAFRESLSSNTTGYAHFQMPVQPHVNGTTSLKLDSIKKIDHFFADKIFPDDHIELGALHGSQMDGRRLTVPIRQEENFMGLMLIEGLDQASFRDEDQRFVDTLSQSLSIALKNIDFTYEVAEKVRMESELRTAAAVQQALFPKRLPELPDVDIATYFQSASETGGDWYGFMTQFEGHLFVLIGDVTGHGTPAALVTATASATTRILEEMFFLSYSIDRLPPSPIDCLKYLNASIYEAGHPNFLMTFFIARINLKTGLVTFSNAGHTFPCLVRGDGKVKRLLNANSRLGYDQNWEFTEVTIQLRKDDVLLFYTDGLTECENTSGEMWGEKRLTRALRKYRHAPTQKLVDKIVEENANFSGSRPLDDDLTLVCCRFLKEFPETNKPS